MATPDAYIPLLRVSSLPGFSAQYHPASNQGLHSSSISGVIPEPRRLARRLQATGKGCDACKSLDAATRMIAESCITPRSCSIAEEASAHARGFAAQSLTARAILSAAPQTGGAALAAPAGAVTAGFRATLFRPSQSLPHSFRSVRVTPRISCKRAVSRAAPACQLHALVGRNPTLLRLPHGRSSARRML